MINECNAEAECVETAEQKCNTRVLCLGNDLLADDSLGARVAMQVRQFAPQDIQVIETPEAGFDLIDYVININQLIVVDTVLTGSAPPGTVYELSVSDMKFPQAGSPHYIGLFEILAVAKNLGMPSAQEVVILAVEASDRLCLGKDMHPAVLSAVPRLVEAVKNRIGWHGGSLRMSVDNHAL